MRRLLLLVTMMLALAGAGWTWDDRGAAHAATVATVIGPGDGDLGCGQYNLGVGVFWPDGSYHVCAWLYYRGFYWT